MFIQRIENALNDRTNIVLINADSKIIIVF